MKTLEKLFKLREALQKQEEMFGINNYSEIERSILEFIANQKLTTISRIIKHQYFSSYSLSTINRVVAKLILTGVIESQQAMDDKRKMYLSFCFK